MARSRSKGILGGLLLAGALALACATERGLEPKPAGFNIYIGGTYWTDPNDVTSPVVHKLYIVDADSLLLRDSIPLRTPATYICTSPDGRWLYVQESAWGLDSGSLLSKIDTKTKTVAWSLHGLSGAMTLVKNGKLLVVDGPNHGDVLSTVDGSVLHSFPDSLRLGRGPVSGTKIAAVILGDTNRIGVFDVDTGELQGSYVPRLSSGKPIRVEYDAVLHPDARRTLVIGASGSSESWFLVGDVETGETLLEYPMVHPFGEIAVSNDGAKAVVTDPSQPFIWDSRPTMGVFDLSSLSLLKRFEFPPPNVRPAQVRFLPGDNRIVTAPHVVAGSEGPLAIFNVASMYFEDSVWIYPRDYPKAAAHVMDGLGVGPRP